MNNKGRRKFLMHELHIEKLTMKESRNARFCAILLVLVTLAGAFSISFALLTAIENAIIKSTGIIAPNKAPIAYKSEIRGVFVHSATFDYAPNWNVIAETLANYKIQAVYGEFVSGTTRYYGSYTNYGDQLGQAVGALHSRGIEVHVSMDVLYVPWDSALKAVDSALNLVDWTCPTKQASRNNIKQIVEEVATNYDIDGFMLDYIRYETASMCFCEECHQKFVADTGLSDVNWVVDVADGGRYRQEFMEWRTIPITELVRDIRNWALFIKPDLEFTLSAWTLFQGSPTYWRYWIGQDATDWINKGYFDAVAPMMYTKSLSEIQDFVQNDFNYMVGGSEGKIPLVSFLTTGIPVQGLYVTPEEFKAEISLIRNLGIDGWIIWGYGGPGLASGSPYPDITSYLSILDMPDVFSLGNIQVSTEATQATITWTTNLPATSKVEHSTTPLFNASFEYSPAVDFHYWDVDHVAGTLVLDATPVTSHSVTLTNLQEGTIYYYRVQSQDESGIATSEVYTFEL